MSDEQTSEKIQAIRSRRRGYGYSETELFIDDLVCEIERLTEEVHLLACEKEHLVSDDMLARSTARDALQIEVSRLQARLQTIVSCWEELACKYHTQRDQARKVSDATGDRLCTAIADRDRFRDALEQVPEFGYQGPGRSDRCFNCDEKAGAGHDLACLRQAALGLTEQADKALVKVTVEELCLRAEVEERLGQQRDEALAEADRYRAALERVEWTPTATGGWCPWCGGQAEAVGPGELSGNHAPDCPRQAALGLTQEPGQ